jgi:beta-phosphoglucomutase
MHQPAPRPSLLFDLDGTLLDTDHLHLEAWNEALGAIGIPPLDAATYRAEVMGRPNAQITPGLLPGADDAARGALADAKEARFRARLDATLAPLPGLARLLDAAEAAGIAKAVVTNAPRANALAMLRGLGWETRFEVLVIGDELPRPKPDPLPYITAMQLLGVPASHAVAFEDSPSGLQAAAGSGAFAVGIATTLDAATLEAAGARLVVRDFTDPALGALLRARVGLSLG